MRTARSNDDRGVPGPLDRFLDRVFGYDWFLSYRRADSEGGSYARALDAELRRRGYRCFFDDREYPGGRVRASLRRAVRRSSTFVLVVTRGALGSEHCRAELAEAVRTGRVLAPILFPEEAGAILAESMQAALAESHGYREAPGRLGHGPSERVLEELVQHFHHRRRESVQRRFLLGLALLLAGLLCASVVLTLLVESKRREVSRMQARALSLLLADRAARICEEAPLAAIALAADGVRRTLESEQQVLPLAESALRAALFEVDGRALWSADGLWNGAVTGAGGIVAFDQERRWKAIGVRGNPIRLDPMERATSVAFADADGESFAFGDATGRMELHRTEAAAFAPVRRLAFDTGPMAIACTLLEHASRLVVGFADGRIECWTTNPAPACVARFQLDDAPALGHSMPIALCRSPVGGAILCGTSDGRLLEIAFPAEAGVLQRDLSFGAPGLRRLAVAPDSRSVGCGGTDGSVTVVALDGTKEPQRQRVHRGPVDALAWIDYTLLASGSDDQTVALWKWREPSSETNPRRMRGHEHPVLHLGVLGGVLYSFDRGGDLRAWSWEKPDASCEPRLHLEPRGIPLAEFVRPSSVLAYVPDHGLVRFDPAGGAREELGTLQQEPVLLAASADGHSVAFAFEGGEVFLRTERPAATERLPALRARPRSLALSEKGDVLLIGDESGGVSLWRRAGGELVSLEPHAEAVGTATLDRNGALALTGDWNGGVRLHDLARGTNRPLEAPPGVAPLEWVYGVSLSSSGRLAAAGGAGPHVLVYQLSARGEVESVRALPVENTVYALAFAPDEKHLAVASPMANEAWVFALDGSEVPVAVRLPALES
ncbi:MAG: TIR domain-containing protein, partial [Planctomycetes bacterium]|nr:TIR domain-containing protein [Planctomycetota bacterium]